MTLAEWIRVVIVRKLDGSGHIERGHPAQGASIARMTPKIVRVVVLFGLISCRSPSPIPLEELGLEDRQILLAVINDPQLAEADRTGNGYLLMDRTKLTRPISGACGGITPVGDLGADAIPVPVELATSIEVRNRIAASRLHDLEIPAGWRLRSAVSNAPNASIITLSLPGVSPDHTTAIVDVSRGDKRNQGQEGYLVLLENRGDGWRIVGHGAHWITVD